MRDFHAVDRALELAISPYEIRGFQQSPASR